MSSKPRDAFVDLYYEDVVIGDEILSDSHTITTEGILQFADTTRDHHPLHTDEDYCREHTEFGKPIAHGLFGLSLIEGLKSELELYQHTSVASLGWDKVRFRQPLFAGDTVHVRVSFLDKRESRSGPHGIVIEQTELVKDDGTVAIEAQHATLLYRRDKLAPGAEPVPARGRGASS
ncbi:MaoC/PaaZ C-terminal domain-containing protein [uncultured Castellaniella sp.]|uniref:MaoC family dehydratase n=1 Tax=uncultured Castellaniella sp. TaxID=647907 RepID=UPI00261B4B51|nr:MaoC/PaaZ C-terminal domain-containing protein [uncultured Castellaniella sp.]